MPERIIDVAIQVEEGNLNAVLTGATAHVTELGKAAESTSPSLAESANQGDVFVQSIQQLNSVIASFQDGLQAIPAHLEEIEKSFHKTREAGEELPGIFGKIEHSAEMREASLSIREAIENPLGAAKQAAESFLLSLGAAGLAGTGLLAIGGAALEAAAHVGELAHEYEKLSGMLGIGLEEAEHLSRTFNLMGIEAGSLTVASRTLSRVLEETTPAGAKLREQLTDIGVNLRDSTGAFRSFDELLPSIITHLQGMTNITERNDLATRSLGRSALVLLGLDFSKFDKLAEGGLKEKQIEDAARYHVVWEQIKQSVGDATDEMGAFIAAHSIALGPKERPIGLGKDKIKFLDDGKESAQAFSTGFDSGIHLDTSAITAQIKSNKLQSTLGVDSSQYDAIVSNNARIAEALKKSNEPAAEAQQHLETLQSELIKYNNVAPNTVTALGITVAALEGQIEAEKAHIQSIKAEGEAIKIRENLIAGEEKHSLAIIEAQKKAADEELNIARKTAEEKAKLQIVGAPLPVTPPEFTAPQVGFTPKEDKSIEFAERKRDSLLAISDEQTANDRAAVQQELAVESSAIAQRRAIQQQESVSPDKSLEQRQASQAAIVALDNEQVAAEDKAAGEIQGIEAKAASEKISINNKFAEEKVAALKRIEEAAKQESDSEERITAAEERRDEDQVKRAEEQSKQMFADHERARAEDLAGAIAHQDRLDDLYRQDVEFQYSLGLISNSQREALLQASFAKEAAAQKASLDAQLANLDTFDSQYFAKKQELLNRLQALQDKESKQEQKNTEEQLKVSSQRYGAFINDVGNAFQNGVLSWVKGQKTFSQAFEQMGQQILSSWISTLLQMGVRSAEHWALEKVQSAEHWALEKVRHIASAASAQTTDATAAATGVVTQKTATSTEIIAAAGLAAANAYAATAAIPFVGPELAPAAAATAFADVLSFIVAEQGAGPLASNTFALLHKDETVLPAKLSKGYQSLIEGGGAEKQDQGQSGGDTHNHFHYSPNISSLDGKGLGEVLDKNRSVFQKKMQRWSKDGVF